MFYELDGIDNFRDLGGLVRTDGARIKDGLLFRSGHLGRASDEAIARLADWGVALIIDMRDKDERDRAPDRAVPGAENIWLPPIPDRHAIMTFTDHTPAKLRQIYHEFYRYLALHPDALEAYTAFFQKLLAAEGRPVLWHCSQGKDRTGVAAILLLTALGFDLDTAIEEYMLTNRFAEKQMEGLRLARASEEEMAVMREVLPVFEVNVRYWADCVQIEYSSLDSYLELALNVGPEQTARLRETYLE